MAFGWIGKHASLDGEERGRMVLYLSRWDMREQQLSSTPSSVTDCSVHTDMVVDLRIEDGDRCEGFIPR